MFIGDRRQTADSMILGLGGQSEIRKFIKVLMTMFYDVLRCFTQFHPHILRLHHVAPTPAARPHLNPKAPTAASASDAPLLRCVPSCLGKHWDQIMGWGKAATSQTQIYEISICLYIIYIYM